jgi:hypothetical protein
MEDPLNGRNVSDSLLEFHIVCGIWGSLGFPYNSCGDSIKKAVAGYVSSFMGVKSVDYFIKKYFRDHNIIIDKESYQHCITMSLVRMRDYIVANVDYYRKIEKPDIPSLFASSAALFRMENSFRGVLLCIKSGLSFEAFTLERNILEQIAWIYSVYNHNGDFLEIQPSKCIRNLKTIYPEAGRLYGMLSNFLHVNPKITPSYVTFDGAGSSVIMRKPEDILTSIRVLLLLIDWYFIMAEIIYYDCLKDYFFIRRDKSFRDNRTSLALRDEILTILESN